LGKGGPKPKCASNEVIFTENESTVLDGTTVLPYDVVDGGKEPKATRGYVTPLNQGG